MTMVFYALIAFFSIYVGKYEKRINIGIIAAPISVPLGILTGIAAFLIFKGLFLALALLLMFIAKVKIIIKLKIAAILSSIAFAMFTSLAGPIGWIISALLIFFVITGIKGVFVSIYEWYFKLMAQILMGIRNVFNNIRKSSPITLHPIVCIIEAALVCGFALKGLWELMDWVDGKTGAPPNLIAFRLFVLLPYLLILYRNYIKDTNPPNVDRDGFDSPLLFDFTNIIDAIF